MKFVGIICMLALSVNVNTVSCNSSMYSDIPEATMNTSEILAYHGYPSETHDITTEDGYIITLVRIPHGKTKAPRQDKPIFLMHGLLDSSDTWVINYPNQSLGFILADKGYDVWLGNIRGNRYARKHVSFKVDTTKFWDFSFNEHAKYDLTASIEYITKTTNSPKINYIGHSQGSMMGFIEFSRNQKIASKVDTFVAFAPTATVNHAKGALKVMSYGTFIVKLFVKLFGMKEFLPQSFWTRYMANHICSSLSAERYCANFFFLLTGFNFKSLNLSRLPVYFRHTPAGTSSKNILHFMQLLKSGQFAEYDYGYFGNYRKYGSLYPPQYDIDKMVTKIVLFNGGNDWISTPKDLATYLLPKLHHIIYSHTVPYYNHMDYIWAIDADSQVYQRMMKVLEDPIYHVNNV